EHGAVDDLVDRIHDQTCNLHGWAREQRFQLRKVIRALERFAVQDLIGAKSVALPEPRPVLGLFRGGLDAVGELAWAQAGEQRLPGHRRQGWQPRKTSVLVEHQSRRSMNDALANLGPLIYRQPVKDHERDLLLAARSAHRKVA